MITTSRMAPSRFTNRCGVMRRWLSMFTLWCFIFSGIAPLTSAQSGNIAPGAIEIDINANLHSGDGNANILNPPANLDWVLDNSANNDVDPDPDDSVAVGITPGVTGATGGTGHWNGVRVIDGVGSGDQNIFLTGGKENDTTTWNVGPGSIGSSKYDVTQAYIANNQSDIFFGMERRGNNGTTAFDFEFNQFGTAGGYIPTRTVGDVLLTFEMQGSGNNGSAEPHYYVWDGSTYVEGTPPAGTLSSINETAIASAPWGFVDSHGNWIIGDIPKFEFAEAKVPLSTLPGVNACGGAAFVQVRTRSSSTPNSDLKDTTEIFRYVFGGPSAVGDLDPSCTLDISYDATGSENSSGGTNNLSYAWQFQKYNTSTSDWDNVGTASGLSGTFTVPSPGTYRSILTVTEGNTTPACEDVITTDSIVVNAILTASASKTGALTPASGFADSGFVANVTGTTNAASGLQWQKKSGMTYVNISGANSSVLALSLVDIFTMGTIVSGSSTFLGDPYNYLVGSVTVRLHVSQNGCTADSGDVTVKALKAVDP